MHLDEFRTRMESYRRDADEDAQSFKDSYRALESLRGLYDRCDADQRAMADQVLI